MIGGRWLKTPIDVSPQFPRWLEVTQHYLHSREGWTCREGRKLTVGDRESSGSSTSGNLQDTSVSCTWGAARVGRCAGGAWAVGYGGEGSLPRHHAPHSTPTIIWEGQTLPHCRCRGWDLAKHKQTQEAGLKRRVRYRWECKLIEKYLEVLCKLK